MGRKPHGEERPNPEHVDLVASAARVAGGIAFAWG